MFKQIILRFAGSFQCRLATDPAPTSSSPSDPFGDIRRPAGMGWTFSYDESPFDQLIRCQTPVQLRTALVDPFEPVKVTQIEVQPEPPLEPFPGFELPFQTIFSDPLLGVPGSLGDRAVFSSSAGGGPSKEGILQCEPRFGTLLSVTPKSLPILKGVERVPGWRTEYLIKKAAAVAPLLISMNTTRRKVLTFINAGPPPSQPHLENYANFFELRDEITPIAADINFIPAGATGILASIVLGWSWTLHLTFSRFDGDTLTGRVEGRLAGLHSSL